MADQLPPASTWLDHETERSLRAVIPHWMTPTSAALHARWWQLETWLRDLVYVELRALRGAKWVDAVAGAMGRLTQDAMFTHMAGPDSENPLAYLDYSQLLRLIDEHWDQFGYALLEREAWIGRQAELTRIRHRIGHMRRPHADDLTRIELTLRDLERGTFIALASYSDVHEPAPVDHNDPITVGWVAKRHPTAERLVDHARRQYDTRVRIRFSRRPWAQPPTDLDGAAGVIWHAEFVMTQGQAIDIADLWHYDLLEPVRPLILHMLSDSPSRVRFTFSAADNAQQLADAIGELFDIVLMVARRIDWETFDIDTWQRRGRSLDYRVQVGTGWAIVDDTTVPVTNFGAGGAVHSKPRW